MQSTDLQAIKDIPGYKVILKTVLKSQIQQLVEHLADHTGEESVILTASVSDGSLSHLGSESGKVFLEDHDDIKSQFLEFCLKRKEQPKQRKKEKQQQQHLQDSGGQILIVQTTPTRHSPGNTPDADSADESNSDTEAIDPDLNIKVEEMATPELDLDMKDLMTQPDNGVMLDLQMRKMFDSLTPGDAQDKTCRVCRYCGKKFKNRSSHRQHEMRHTGVGPYSCSYCEKTSFSKSHHERHEATHSNQKKFVCSDSNCGCGKQFKAKDDLSKHVKRKNKQLNFSCDVCGILWESKKELMDHQTKHTGVKGHICETCGAAFRYRNNLFRHKKIHSQAPDSFQCSQCGKCFSREGTLKDHRLICFFKFIHKCRYCHKGFKCERYLRLHEKRVHK